MKNHTKKNKIVDVIEITLVQLATHQRRHLPFPQKNKIIRQSECKDEVVYHHSNLS